MVALAVIDSIRVVLISGVGRKGLDRRVILNCIKYRSACTAKIGGNAHLCKIFFGAVILALLFAHAGYWQRDRARQKQNLAAAMEERARLPPLRVSGAINKDEALRYRKVVAAGEFAPHGSITKCKRGAPDTM